jgi:hypothetical protein
MTSQPGRARARFRILLVVVLALAAFAGCGDDNGDDGDGGDAVAGTFVGKAPGTEALVAVVASPAAEGKDERNVTLYVCDARSLCEWLSGTSSGNEVEVTAGDGQATVELGEDAATGTIELPDEEAIDYTATPAAATAGLYTLSVTPDGELRGASAAGVALRGETTLPRPGPGTLKLADRSTLKFEITEGSAGDSVPLPSGQVRLIVLPSDELAGAGKNRDDSDFLIGSPSK